jgi:predicted naringenin-chalcone synthase
MSNSNVYLASVGTASPPCKITQDEAGLLAKQQYEGLLTERSMDLLMQVLAHPSIQSRYLAVDNKDYIPLLKNEDPDIRVARFTQWALSLAVDAARKALDSCGVNPTEITAVFVNTCTGYICPGISTYLIEKLSLNKNVHAVDFVGSGCGGALPNLHSGESHVRLKSGNVALCISVEICTATFQMDNDPSLLISNAIFGDGAAAAVLWDRSEGMKLSGYASQFAPQYRDDVRYVYKKGQLHNRLSSQLPKIICSLVPEFIQSFIVNQGISIDDISHWALHPGGDKMIVGLQQCLKLSNEHMAPTRSVLRDFGNMSSPTVLFIAERILKENTMLPKRMLLCAYGAGLSMHTYLLEG